MTFPLSAIQDLAAERKSALATGPFGSSIGSKTFQDHGVPVIRGSNLSEAVGLRLNDDGLVFIDPSLADKFSRSKAVRGDLVFTCWGTVNQVGLIDERSEYEEYIVSNKQMKLSADPEKADPLFLYYYFSSPLGQQAIADNTIGSSVPGFNLTALKSIRVPNPPLKVQAGISEFLGALDDKIELNRRMNETLEEMARALFRDWFVDFGPTRRQMEGATDPAAIMGHAFPPEKAATLAPLFPAKLGDNGLPEGWRHCALSDLCKITSGKRPPLKADKQTPENPVPVWGGNGIGWYTSQKLFDTPLIVTGRVGTLGTVYRVPSAVWVSDNALCVFPMGGKYEFVFQSMKTFDYRSLNSGSTQPLITQTALKKQVCIDPGQGVLDHFEEVTASLTAKLRSNDQENQTLAEMRDLLLPKLMSGEIRLQDVEAAV